MEDYEKKFYKNLALDTCDFVDNFVIGVAIVSWNVFSCSLDTA